MSRSTIHISVPEASRRYVEQRVEEEGYGSVSEFFRELIRDDRQRHLVRMKVASRTGPAPDFRTVATSAQRQK